MALVARTRRADLVIGGRGTLMGRCVAGGLPVASACSGQGACARCLVTVLAGAAHLSPPRPHESRTLDRNEAASNQRLSCQCRVTDPSADVLITTGYW
ncbi:2Fe-2S iron-sulfur cluster-binding protein [Geothrix oryzisoli]|uniref:2Fe-2S iron-sulfur cluster-binding protein n=1 Tax=Geothrix oryzisoli TaxID=2922721 RepID=UPI001FAB5094|nr:2Fe-2S iron-sulfur cluster-binding protein [Geothrix oryzisoli]